MKMSFFLNTICIVNVKTRRKKHIFIILNFIFLFLQYISLRLSYRCNVSNLSCVCEYTFPQKLIGSKCCIPSYSTRHFMELSSLNTAKSYLNCYHSLPINRQMKILFRI